MKVSINNGVTSFIPETETELRTMLRMVQFSDRIKEMAVAPKTKKIKMQYKKVCKFVNPNGEVCGKRVKGLETHMAWHNSGSKGRWGRPLKVEVEQLASEVRTA